MSNLNLRGYINGKEQYAALNVTRYIDHIRSDVKEMFDGYSEYYDGWFGDGYIIKSRSVNFHTGRENDKTRQVSIFYNSLKGGNSLQEAKVHSGLDYKDAKHYLSLLNKLLKQRGSPPLLTSKKYTKSKITKPLKDNEVVIFISNMDEHNEAFLEEIDTYLNNQL